MSDSQLPPHDIRAEQSVLASVMIAPECLGDVTPAIVAGDFYLASHQMIFEAMVRLDAQRIPADAVTVSADLEAHQQLEEIGGVEYLVKVLESVPHAAHAKYYAGIVRETSIKRQLVYFAGDLHQMARESALDAAEIVRKCEATFTKLIDGGKTREPVHASEGTLRFIQTIESPELSPATPTLFSDLDRKLNGGLRPGQLIILGAGTSIGKTSLTSNIATNVARSSHVLVISREMNSTECYGRYIPAVLRLPQIDVEDRFRAGETEWLFSRFNEFSQLRISVDDYSRSLSEIDYQTRRMVRKYGTRLVIVDYLQQIEGNNRRASRQEQVAEVSRFLKTMAGDRGVTVLALSQLSRAANEDGVRPELHHLRESGAIEHDADVVLLLSRQRDSTDAILDVAKNRSGETGVLNLEWRKDICRFDQAVAKWFSAETFDPMADF